MSILMVAVIFCATLLVLILAITIMGPKEEAKSRLQDLEEQGSLKGGAGYPAGDEKFLQRVVREMGSWIESPYWDRLLSHKIMQAGILMRSSEFVILWAVSIVGLAGLFHLLLWKRTEAAFIIGAVLGALLPLLVLRLRIARRRAAFNDQLADAIMLVSNSLRSGYSFLQAVELVGREVPAPLGQEFSRLFREMNLGVTTENALDNLSKRVESADLDLVIVAVLIQRQIGGNLAEVLDNIAKTIRARIKLRGQVKTLTAQGRVSGYVVGGLPFVTAGVIQLISPHYLDGLFTDALGQKMLWAALGFQFVGIMIIRRIVDIRL